MFKYLSKLCQINLRSIDHEFRSVIEFANAQGYSCLIYAVKNMNHELINFIIQECFATIQNHTEDQQNVLHIAAKNRDIQTI